MSLVIRIFGATLPERLGPRRMVTVALLAFAVGLLAVAAIDAVWVLWFAAALIGIGAAFNYPSLNALTVNRVSDGDRALAISSFTMFFEIGSAFSGLSIGLLGESRRQTVGVLRWRRDGARPVSSSSVGTSCRLVRPTPARSSRESTERHADSTTPCRRRQPIDRRPSQLSGFRTSKFCCPISAGAPPGRRR